MLIKAMFRIKLSIFLMLIKAMFRIKLYTYLFNADTYNFQDQMILYKICVEPQFNRTPEFCHTFEEPPAPSSDYVTVLHFVNSCCIRLNFGKILLDNFLTPIDPAHNSHVTTHPRINNVNFKCENWYIGWVVNSVDVISVNTT